MIELFVVKSAFTCPRICTYKLLGMSWVFYDVIHISTSYITCGKYNRMPCWIRQPNGLLVSVPRKRDHEQDPDAETEKVAFWCFGLCFTDRYANDRNNPNAANSVSASPSMKLVSRQCSSVLFVALRTFSTEIRERRRLWHVLNSHITALINAVLLLRCRLCPVCRPGCTLAAGPSTEESKSPNLKPRATLRPQRNQTPTEQTQQLTLSIHVW